jgi:hypothetical protein
MGLQKDLGVFNKTPLLHMQHLIFHPSIPEMILIVICKDPHCRYQSLVGSMVIYAKFGREDYGSISYNYDQKELKPLDDKSDHVS